MNGQQYMRRQVRRAMLAVAAATAMGVPTAARAQLALNGGQIDAGGGGLGAQSTVLTLQSPGSTSSASGCISPSGSTNCSGFTNVGLQSGANQSLLRPVSDFSGLTANNFRIVFNAAEPGNDNTITLNNAIVSLYRADGSVAFSSQAIAAPITFTNTLSGVGNFGFGLGLTGADLVAFQNALNSNTGLSIGLGASIADAQGGNDTFSIALASVGTTTVPEPTTVALLAAGMLGIAGVARRRRA